MRTCVVCRARRDDDHLVRVGQRGGQWYVGRGEGRGAWLCAVGTCRDRLAAGQLARALRAPVGDAEAAALIALLAEGPSAGVVVKE
ncbi:MAG: DUF448 domain-containing protein [Acidimicrobiales bacterium]